MADYLGVSIKAIEKAITKGNKALRRILDDPEIPTHIKAAAERQWAEALPKNKHGERMPTKRQANEFQQRFMNPTSVAPEDELPPPRDPKTGKILGDWTREMLSGDYGQYLPRDWETAARAARDKKTGRFTGG